MIMLHRIKGCGDCTEYLNVRIAGLDVRIFVDGKAQRIDDKYEALVNALKKISLRCTDAFNELPVVAIYFTAETGAEACWYPESPDGTPYLILGDRTLFRVNKIIPGRMRALVWAILAPGEWLTSCMISGEW